MTKQTVHYLKIRVTFDKPISRVDAVKTVGDELRGYDFYPPQYRDDQPGTVRVTGVTGKGVKQ